MLESLTKEQEAKLPFYKDKWMAYATASVPKGFYDDGVKETIKDAVMGFYKAADKPLDRSNILFSESPLMAMFEASAFECGNKGTPKKPVKWKGDAKITGMAVVENFLNTFKNPKEIIKKSGQYVDCIYWGMSEAGFCGFLEFFKTETNILVDFSNVPHLNTITQLTHFLIITEKFCVVAMRPCVFRHNEGIAIADGKPYMVWPDGVGIIA